MMPTAPGGRERRGGGETGCVASEPLILLAGVRGVAALANPEEPKAVTQRAFDAARARSTEHAALPPARRIAERLGMPWREVLSVAHEPEAAQSKLLGAKDRGPRSTDWLSEAHVAAAIQLVAARLAADTVSMNEYRTEQGRIVAADRERWFHGRQLLVPTDQQIVHVTGSWYEALRFAGLGVQRVRGPTRKRPNTPTLVDLMERFYDAHGVQPTARALKTFARANGIPYPSVPAGKGFSKALRQWRKRRRAAGVSTARAVRHKGGRGNQAPDYSLDVGAALPGERRTDEWDRDSCVAAVARYVAQLGPGERSTSRGYRDWASRQEHAPVMTTIQRHGGWEAVRRAALNTLRPARAESESSVGDRRLVAKDR